MSDNKFTITLSERRSPDYHKSRRWENESMQSKPVGGSSVHFHNLKIADSSVVKLNNATLGNVDMSEESKQKDQEEMVFKL
ncbi:14060_t:CDS:2 [Ambispora leptoticha]|uniref:14060_t:CDS:1 n=1 Tax=Ambispora leptoticha TaxID=144679 RepID=A0A9N9BCN1_9GLOM|nr:14060_t:CDS:2 [Ambispora leptoticha]